MSDEWDEPDVETLAAPESASAGPLADEEPDLVFGSVDEFVRQKLALQYRRPLERQHGAIRWAPEWWRYPEAVSRLTALWRAWEHLRLDPALGMAISWRAHLSFDEDHGLGGASEHVANCLDQALREYRLKAA